MATPSFLNIYHRTCEAEDFASLQVVMSGAEKLQNWLATDFEDKFGLRPLEGYGCTECSPVVAANRHSLRGQIGVRHGKIGRPMPGMSVRIIHPQTRNDVRMGEPGLLLVRGPNVMIGYLHQPQKTVEVLRDGWYETGDVVTLDEDGFLEITGRLSRFSKIGGEMVPHDKVEEKLHELAGVHEPTFVVTGVPDEHKGEKLVVLHKLEEAMLSSFLPALPKLELPNLWIPKASQFFRVEQLPLLGSGKLDLSRLNQLARELTARSEPAPASAPCA